MILSLLATSIVIASCTNAPVSPVNSDGMAAVGTTVQASVSKDKVKAIMVKAFDDEEFNQKLQANPIAELKNEGVDQVPEGDKVRIVDYTSGKAYLILDDRNLIFFYPDLVRTEEVAESEVQKIFTSIRNKASTNANFKASLLADSAQVLSAEGINAEAAKQIDVLDYQANTHFLLVLPPEQEISRSSNLPSLISGPIDVIKTTVPPFLVSLGIGEFSTAIAYAESTQVRQLIDNGIEHVFGISEASCAFIRFWGGSCGVSKTEIKAAILAGS